MQTRSQQDLSKFSIFDLIMPEHLHDDETDYEHLDESSESDCTEVTPEEQKQQPYAFDYDSDESYDTLTRYSYSVHSDM